MAGNSRKWWTVSGNEKYKNVMIDVYISFALNFIMNYARWEKIIHSLITNTEKIDFWERKIRLIIIFGISRTFQN